MEVRIALMDWLRRFMMGRYGMDPLSGALFVLYVAALEIPVPFLLRPSAAEQITLLPPALEPDIPVPPPGGYGAPEAQKGLVLPAAALQIPGERPIEDQQDDQAETITGEEFMEILNSPAQ